MLAPQVLAAPAYKRTPSAPPPAGLARVGSVLGADIGVSDSGSTSITVPSGAELMVVAVTGYKFGGGDYSYFYNGALTLDGNAFTTGAGFADTDINTASCVLFYIDVRSIGAGSKTLAWNWAVDTSNFDEGVNIAYAFYGGGVNFTGGPIRSSGADRHYTGYSIGLSAVTGDILVAAVYEFDNPSANFAWSGATQQILQHANSCGVAYAEGAPSTGTATLTIADIGSNGHLVAFVIKGS
jgi:hypothetical protein